MYNAVIIGAGPAGMMAAIAAGERGKRVLLLEKNNVPGRKLLISGKGRANVTNAETDQSEFFSAFSRSGQFLRNSFSVFSNGDLMRFIEENGVPLKTERGGRVFPVSDQAGDILRLLQKKIKVSHVDVRTAAVVTAVSRAKKAFNVTINGSETVQAGKIVVATGGLSYPQTGSTGFGFSLAREFGHTVNPLKPALVGLESAEQMVSEWQGISLRNVNAAILSNGKKVDQRFGEMIFTHYGISGPIILDVSARVFDEIKKKKEVIISIDLKPALAYDRLDARLRRECMALKQSDMRSVLKTLIPHNMVNGFMRQAGVKAGVRVSQLTKTERKRVLNTLKGLSVPIRRARPVEEAIVTRGGVDIKEIHPKTMESKRVPGLYFAGEVIDVDAGTGGYNMQAAFTTGYAAGKNI